MGSSGKSSNNNIGKSACKILKGGHSSLSISNICIPFWKLATFISWDWPRRSAYTLQLCRLALGTLNRGNRGCLRLFYWHLRPYSPYWFALTILNTWEGAQSRCNLVCHVLLILMGDLSFPGWIWKRRGWVWGRRKIGLRVAVARM